jgi:5-methylcytosine-specific restriction endonuclease McrA
MTYFKFPKRPSKTTERQKLVHKLDDAFSEYIRLRDADSDGIVTCITCEDRHHWTGVDCGHFVPRANMATRWDLKNCNSQCRLCNSTQDGAAELHAVAIDRMYGEGTAEKLEKMGKQERHFSEHELQGMLDELRKEIKALKAEKFN